MKGYSPFQIQHYQVFDFRLKNSYVDYDNLKGDLIKHNFSRDVEVEFSQEHSLWQGSLIINYCARYDRDSDSGNTNESVPDRFSLDTSIVCLCVYKADNSDAEKQRFIELIKYSATISMLATLRGIVAASTAALGFRPGIILPSLNLNEFDWQDNE